MSIDRAWADVKAAHAKLGETRIADLFAADGARFDAFSASAGDLFLDFSKQRIDRDSFAALVALADSANVAVLRDRMIAGDRINATEGRAVRHMALRAPADDPAFADVASDVHGVLDRVLAFADDVRAGRATAHDGQPFTDVINIGIGGSDLGPVMVTAALVPDCDGPRVHYVSNVDGAHLADTLAGLNPARTLVLIASKSFTTLETMMNARSARRWIAEALGEEAVGAHFAALSTNLEAVAAFGIAEDRVFGFWDWVGGRYSLWSAIGLPIAIAIGPPKFRELLAGAYEMDRHFRSAPMMQNLPVLAALIGIWNRNVEEHDALALIPYDQRLQRLPAYVQQLDMESNGKRVQADGQPVGCDTAPVIWGEPGTNAQHAFFQMLHQGTTIVPVEFLVAARAREADPALGEHHIALLANCLAQSEALMRGETEAEARDRLAASGASEAEIDALAAHKVFPGNRPSSTLLYPELTPHVLGQIIAFYEQKVFVQAAVWGINAFDQWGVQLGKVLADEVLPLVTGETEATAHSASTNGLAARARAMRG
jgi:glucose-6-phosphate isomerase